jgi:hypothetical protein
MSAHVDDIRSMNRQTFGLRTFVEDYDEQCDRLYTA